MKPIKNDNESGMALVSMLLILALLMTLLTGYFALTRMELSTTRSTMDSFRGFYAAESGLNIRAEIVRQNFQGFTQPAGTSPDPDSTDEVCTGSNQGSGDLGCQTYSFVDRSVSTYLEQELSGQWLLIPRGEILQNLNAEENLYVAYSQAKNDKGSTEALLEMHFRSREVPLFQFAVYYENDLEIQPAPSMTFSGPIHTNGDLYLGTANTIEVHGQITTAGDIYKGPKTANSCPGGSIEVIDPDDLVALAACSGSRKKYVESDFDSWGGMVRVGETPFTSPSMTMLDAVAGEPYWDRADLRIMLDLNGTPAIEIRSANDVVQGTATTALAACAVTRYTTTMTNQRESKAIDMLDVDVQGLLDCVHASSLLGVSKGLDDTTDDGLVFYFGVDGPDSAAVNSYGVRLLNGDTLESSISLAPEIVGLTVVTDQALYVQGDYNSTKKRPAALLADSINVLSNNWDDTNSAGVLADRTASNTTIQAAFLTGTDSTAGLEGTAGQDLGLYGGGVENLPRMLEDWSGATLTYRGSFVSLGNPRHVSGAFVLGTPQFSPPTRDWDFDVDFEEANDLPPLTPQMVYLRQELFLREFEL